MYSNKLSPAQLERLALVAEEASEVAQIISKIIRHGYFSEHPSTGIANQESLEIELGHLHHVIERLIGSGDVRLMNVQHHSLEKAKTIHKYLHHQ